jgi:hypothetical protein
MGGDAKRPGTRLIRAETAMEKLKLSALLDDKPVKLRIELAVHRAS